MHRRCRSRSASARSRPPRSAPRRRARHDRRLGVALGDDPPPTRATARRGPAPPRGRPRACPRRGSDASTCRHAGPHAPATAVPTVRRRTRSIPSRSSPQRPSETSTAQSGRPSREVAGRQAQCRTRVGLRATRTQPPGRPSSPACSTRPTWRPAARQSAAIARAWASVSSIAGVHLGARIGPGGVGGVRSGRGAAPPTIPGPLPCRSRPMPLAVTASRGSGTGSRTGPRTTPPCASAAA